MTAPPTPGDPAALQLISFPICPFVHRATTTLREKGVDYEITYIDIDAKPDWFLALSPRGLVPVLVTGGTPLFESTAILEYLDETRGPRFLPEDPVERARHRAWVAVSGDLLTGQFRISIASNEAELTRAAEAARRSLEVFEAAVKLPLFAGEAFGMVDAAAAPGLFRLLLIEQRSELRFFDTTPRVRQWAENLASRPSVTGGVRATFADEYLDHSRKKGGELVRRLTSPAEAARPR